jgi:mRNA interferase RelE/StbE
VPFTLLYHPQVVEEDLSHLPQNIHSRVARAIESRLVEAPEQHGTPLKGTLKGYWKLRIGDYRVVYKIIAAEVWIFGIIHRKKIYEDIKTTQLASAKEVKQAPSTQRVFLNVRSALSITCLIQTPPPRGLSRGTPRSASF